MRLEVLGSNMTVVHIEGNEYFFSYDTCVAGWDKEDGPWKVDHKYSNTTSRHVNKYFNGVEPTLVSKDDAELALMCV